MSEKYFFNWLKAETGLPMVILHPSHLTHNACGPLSHECQLHPSVHQYFMKTQILSLSFFPTQMSLSHIFPTTSDFPCIPKEIRSPKHISTSCVWQHIPASPPAGTTPSTSSIPTYSVCAENYSPCIIIHTNTGTLLHICPFRWGCLSRSFLLLLHFPPRYNCSPYDICTFNQRAICFLHQVITEDTK